MLAARIAAYALILAAPMPLVPLAEVLSRYLYTVAARGVSIHTLKAYRNDLRAFSVWAADDGAAAPPDIDHARVTKWVATLRDAGYAEATLDRKLTSVRLFHEWMRDHGIVQQSLRLEPSLRSRGRALPRSLERGQIEAMIAACDDRTFVGARDRALLEFLYSTGCRCAEASALDVEQVSVSGGTALVLGKGRKERLVAIGAPARKALRRYLERWRRPSTIPYHARAVFQTRDGARLSERMIHSRVQAIGRAAGISNAHPHKLRHSFAQHMIEAGCDSLQLSHMMGHASVSTTQRYTHVDTRAMLELHARYHPRARLEGPTDSPTPAKPAP